MALFTRGQTAEASTGGVSTHSTRVLKRPVDGLTLWLKTKGARARAGRGLGPRLRPARYANHATQ